MGAKEMHRTFFSSPYHFGILFRRKSMTNIERTEYLARLSGFDLSKDEIEMFAKDMEDIIAFADKINSADINLVCERAEAEKYGELRDDAPEHEFDGKDIMRNSKTGFDFPKIM